MAQTYYGQKLKDCITMAAYQTCGKYVFAK